jgi:hypothetical protein
LEKKIVKENANFWAIQYIFCLELTATDKSSFRYWLFSWDLQAHFFVPLVCMEEALACGNMIFV